MDNQIDRLITAGWGVPLQKTHVGLSIYPHHVIMRAALDLVRKKKLGTSGSNYRIGTSKLKKWVLLHIHMLYIPCAVHDHARDLSGQSAL